MVQKWHQFMQSFNQQHNNMGKFGALISSNFVIISILAISILSKATEDEDRKVHIVYMGAFPEDVNYLPEFHHLSILQTVMPTSSASKSLILSYKRSFNGFAANLTGQERQKLASLKEVVSVFPSKTFETQTTRSWDFMGFKESAMRQPAVESNIIIGVIDSGIWPESDSFSDKGFGPPPKKWNGACKGGTNFTCNNKIIGARFYSSFALATTSVRDEIGHGTHTASTAAGNQVKDASFYGIAEGTARGAVPSARIAAYKVCSPRCDSHNILAAMDDAISDGVDIITMSLAIPWIAPFDQDPTAIGSFHAMERGILVVNSAGNYGPGMGSTASVAPWLLSVGASSTDRLIVDKVVLRNGTTFTGSAVNSYTLNGTAFPLVYGKTASSGNCSEERAKSCNSGCLDRGLIEGKILVCDVLDPTNEAALTVGSLGLIAPKMDPQDVSRIYPIAASFLDARDFIGVQSYLNSTDHPEATILKSESIKDPTAPMVASFSSRGPNVITPDILKPDIIAPGIDILAGFSPLGSPSISYFDKRHVNYSILSGTSMSSPHAAGAAAYVKTFHPDWSPSAIKSSLMTTAWAMNNSQSTVAGEFSYGSGLINPTKAINPGLVYEISKEDYIKFLCNAGFEELRVRLIAGHNISCPHGSEIGYPRDLNYPSMTAKVSQDEAFSVTFHRTVKNVGISNSTYRAEISNKSPLLDIRVVPEILSFESLNQEKSFDVIVKGKLGSSEPSFMASASLVWTDGAHHVRSPIIVHSFERHGRQNLG